MFVCVVLLCVCFVCLFACLLVWLVCFVCLACLFVCLFGLFVCLDCLFVARYRCVPKIASSEKNNKVLQSENEKQNE